MHSGVGWGKAGGGADRQSIATRSLLCARARPSADIAVPTTPNIYRPAIRTPLPVTSPRPPIPAPPTRDVGRVNVNAVRCSHWRNHGLDVHDDDGLAAAGPSGDCAILADGGHRGCAVGLWAGGPGYPQTIGLEQLHGRPAGRGARAKGRWVKTSNKIGVEGEQKGIGDPDDPRTVRVQHLHFQTLRSGVERAGRRAWQGERR